ncbi:hydroxyacid dehydrogenase [Salinicola sp. LHM]|uniref:hydroxyacid dehydrogenase n=1 Tax=Salinicola sp. LHM TaxID=3065298 RepID=UPI002ACE9676|nr:hydroxyacid dehydrogenase [Salinicola sp. LHM]MEC8918053.1 hydroxyacid dehydrogenase [Pseudomonadota bacterium]MED5501340.1 hydroxyacid dehydrogenase [Pseudomonadota bacterium]WQH33086.1 hydroxyacid dehydrogenase [Salinicola sp. LHM]
MTDVLISEFMDEAAVADLEKDCSVTFDVSLVDDRERLLLAGADVRALIVRNRTRVDRELLAHFPDLIAVGRLGVGLDNIDLEACRESDIAVLPATGGNTVSVAEYVLTGIFMLRRVAYLSTPRVLAGEWPRQALMGHETQGATLGLVGFGGIARDLARRAQCLGMQVMAHDPFVSENDAAWQTVERVERLEALLAAADAVSLHVPLTEGTRHLIDGEALMAMKPGSLLINTARGGIVDEAALAASLREGHLGGAMLDVFEDEPLTDGSVLAGVEGLIATPHIAGVTHESNTRISWITVDNVRRALGVTA